MSEAPKQLSDLLRSALEKSPLRHGLQRQQALECWPDVVGDEIAKHTRAVSIHEGVLRIQVESAVWAQELVLLRPQIISGFAQRLGPGEVREIRFHSGTQIL